MTLNKPTVLSTGEWMLPVSLNQSPEFGPSIGCIAKLGPLSGAHVFVSKDHGKNWEQRGNVSSPEPDWHEHMVVERIDGSLWMLARTRNGVMETTSVDDGKIWTTPVLSPVKQPAAHFHIRRLDFGNILLIKHGDKIDHHEGRVQFSA